MINIGFGQWRTIAPPGLSQTGRIRRFQNRTVQRLGQVAQQLAARTYQELVSVVESSYQEGEGTLAGSLQYRVTTSRDEISVEFVSGARHIVYLTGLVGGAFNPQGHIIRARNARQLRFFWKNPTGGGAAGVYSFRQVHWRTRVGQDVIGQTLSAGAQEYVRAMIAAHDDAFVEFQQNELQLSTRSTRVGVTTNSQ
jgi:hypothetical protein